MSNDNLEKAVLLKQRSHSSMIFDLAEEPSGQRFLRVATLSQEAAEKNQIPKIIHKIWWQGLKELPDKYLKPLESWASINPDWIIVVWDEQAIFEMIEKYFPTYKRIMNDYPYMIQKIDAAKYFFMEKFGGLYSDMDQFCINPIEKICDPEKEKADFICSLLTEKKSMVILTSSFKFGTGPYCNNAFCISKPGTEVWEFIRHTLVRKSDTKLTHITKELAVLNTTGPVMFTKGVRAAIDYIKQCTGEHEVDTIRLLESKYIDPYSVYFKLGKKEHFEELLENIIADDEALCISYMTSSWSDATDEIYAPVLAKLVHLKHKKGFRHSKTIKETDSNWAKSFLKSVKSVFEHPDEDAKHPKETAETETNKPEAPNAAIVEEKTIV